MLVRGNLGSCVPIDTVHAFFMYQFLDLQLNTVVTKHQPKE